MKVKTDKRDTDSSDKPKTKAKMKIGNKNKKKGKKKKNFANDEAEHQVKKIKNRIDDQFFFKNGLSQASFLLIFGQTPMQFLQHNIHPVSGAGIEPRTTRSGLLPN